MNKAPHRTAKKKKIYSFVLFEVMMGVDSLWWWARIEWATGRKWNTGSYILTQGRTSLSERWSTGTGCPDCGVYFSGDNQDLSGYICATCWGNCCGRGLDSMISRGLLQPAQFCDSVKLNGGVDEGRQAERKATTPTMPTSILARLEPPTHSNHLAKL